MVGTNRFTQEWAINSDYIQLWLAENTGLADGKTVQRELNLVYEPAAALGIKTRILSAPFSPLPNYTRVGLRHRNSADHPSFPILVEVNFSDGRI